MKRLLGLVTVAMIVNCVELIGCAELTPTVTFAPEIGSNCTVNFRRDALGSWGRGITDPAVAIEGNAGWISGSFSRMNDDWLILTQKDSEHWIPRNMILLVEVDDK